MKSRSCSARNCQATHWDKGVKFFHFSRNPTRAQVWAEKVGLHCTKEDLEFLHNKFICSRHFSDNDFITSEKIRLNRVAVPSLLGYPTTTNDPGTVTQHEHQPGKANVRKQTCIDLQPSQNEGERVKMTIHDYVQPGSDIFRANSMPLHAGSYGNQTDFRKPMENVGDAAVSQEEVSETCDTASEHGDTDDVYLISNEPCTVATYSLENLPNQLCRLCASTDEHPKQSIVGWLDMLNEIIPDLVALNDGLPQHVCRPCANKLLTCNKIKADFIEANNKLQDILGFSKLSGIQFMDLLPDLSGQQSIDNVNGKETVSAEEEIVSGISGEELLRDEEIISDIVDAASLNFEEPLISQAKVETNLNENFTQNESDSVNNVSDAYDLRRQKVRDRKTEKFKYVCAECEEIFTRKGALRIHRKTHLDAHTKELPFMCEFCGKCFRSTTLLKYHVPVHKPPRYSCPMCHKKFHSSVYLTQHKRSHYTDTKLICELCGKILYTPSSLEIHLRIHTGEKPFQCAVCGICFISAGRLRIHRLRHTDIKFRCDNCDKEFGSKKTLVVHKQSHFKLNHYKCPICFKTFAYSSNRRRHCKEICKPVCVVCNKIFLTNELVEEHRRNEHTQEKVEAAAARVHREQSERTKNADFLDKCCPVCSETISGNMLKHIKEYHRDYNYKPFACEQCPKTFSTSRGLHNHRKRHSENRPFTCATCGKKFKTKNTLKWHDSSVHQNARPFQCQCCDRQFKRLSNLIVHKRKHTGERPYPCPICMQTFVTKGDMLKHAKKHSQNSDNVARLMEL